MAVRQLARTPSVAEGRNSTGEKQMNKASGAPGGRERIAALGRGRAIKRKYDRATARSVARVATKRVGYLLGRNAKV